MSEGLEKLPVEPSLDLLKQFSGMPARYVGKEIIGSGGMAVIYRAADLHLERDVAIKVLISNDVNKPEQQERFAREAKVLAGLNHVNIVKLLAWGNTAETYPFQVMELLHGVPLSREVGEGKRLSLKRFRKICSDVLSGLQYAHEQGIVHRDIKPSNIMLCEDVSDLPQAKLIDFGIVRVEGANTDATLLASLTRASATNGPGSPAYMSPEQCRGEVATQLSDIYSFGCVMYECLAGVHPFAASSVYEFMQQHASAVPPILIPDRSCPAAKSLTELVSKCLEKDPQKRPQSASELRLSLEQIFQNVDTEFCIFISPGERSSGKTAGLSIFKWCLGAGGVIAAIVLLCILFKPTPVKIFHESVSRESAKARRQVQRLKEATVSVKRWQQRYDQSSSHEAKANAGVELIEKLLTLAKTENQMEDPKAAESHLLSALTLCDSYGSSENKRKGLVLTELGMAYKRSGELVKAKEYLQQGCRLLHSIVGSSDWASLNSTFELALVKIELKELDSMTPFMDQLLQGYYVYATDGLAKLSVKVDESALRRVRAIRGSLLKLTELNSDQESQRSKLLLRIANWFSKLGIDPDDVKPKKRPE